MKNHRERKKNVAGLGGGEVRGEKETNAREDFHNFLNLADDMVGRGQRTWQARFVFQESLTNLSRDCSTEARPGDEARTREMR